MDDAMDFIACLNEMKSKDWKESEPTPPPPSPPPPKVELSTAQKRIVLDYILCSSKGIFEDCDEFWEGVDDVDDQYPSFRRAVEEYVDALKQRLLAELGFHG